MSKPKQRRKLLLTIEVPGIYADDLDENTSLFMDEEIDKEITDKDRADLITEEWCRAEVVLTICTIPGDGCLSDGFEMHPYQARIVGARTVDR